jgi:hypothetical protein
VRRILALIVLGPIVLLALWTLVFLNLSFSNGERAGYVQKFSRRGWVCKTWEGELAMVNMPGAMSEVFHFSVRDEAAVRQIQDTMGQRVVLSYDQHRGVPTSCFAETSYFVTAARVQGGNAQ